MKISKYMLIYIYVRNILVLNECFSRSHLYNTTPVFTLTVPTRPNLTESGPKPDPGFAFGVRSGSARADPQQTLTGRKANPEQTPSGRKANLESEPHLISEANP